MNIEKMRLLVAIFEEVCAENPSSSTAFCLELAAQTAVRRSRNVFDAGDVAEALAKEHRARSIKK
jgi:hypothetical protein